MGERWPALPFGAWQDTCETLHLWTQIVGKVKLESENNDEIQNEG